MNSNEMNTRETCHKKYYHQIEKKFNKRKKNFLYIPVQARQPTNLIYKRNAPKSMLKKSKTNKKHKLKGTP